MRIGARGSDLAQVQARMIESMLNHAGIETEMLIISTHGDRVLDRPLNQLGAQGVFTKEIEDALLQNLIDLAVHSFKDVASVQPPGLEIVAVTEREDCADLLIIRPERFIAGESILPLQHNVIVGTSAVRRSAQLTALRPDLHVRDLRGNVPTRLDKLRNNEYDAILLASAGVNRLQLDLSEFKVFRLDPNQFVPSPGQGALAIEMRVDDPYKIPVQKTLHHELTYQATVIERSLLKLFGGGCSLPLGAWAQISDSKWNLQSFWGGDKEPKWTSNVDTDPEKLVLRAYDELCRAT